MASSVNPLRLGAQVVRPAARRGQLPEPAVDRGPRPRRGYARKPSFRLPLDSLVADLKSEVVEAGLGVGLDDEDYSLVDKTKSPSHGARGTRSRKPFGAPCAVHPRTAVVQNEPP